MIASCKTDDTGKLPILGAKQVVNGEKVPHSIPNWEYVNSKGESVTDDDLSEYIYISDFFFTSCPTICPKVKREMKRIYTEFEDEPLVKFVSFTIDPKRDTPEKLNQYASKLNIDTDKWWFLTGDQDGTYELAESYLQVAFEDADVPGGFNHSGKMILTDKNGHLRAFSEGTDPEETPRLIKDIKKLLTEYAQK